AIADPKQGGFTACQRSVVRDRDAETATREPRSLQHWRCNDPPEAVRRLQHGGGKPAPCLAEARTKEVQAIVGKIEGAHEGGQRITSGILPLRFANVHPVVLRRRLEISAVQRQLAACEAERWTRETGAELSPERVQATRVCSQPASRVALALVPDDAADRPRISRRQNARHGRAVEGRP